VADFPYTADDLKCHDGTPYPDEFKQDRLPELMSLLRGIWEIHPFDIVSAYRSPAYNAKLAGKSTAHQVASGSYHVQGQACDLRPRDCSVLEFQHAIIAAHSFGDLPEMGGTGIYPVSNWVHVDTGHAPDGHLRRWTGQ